MDIAKACKYALDRLFALLLLALTGPLLLLIAVAIRVDSPGSPLFLQARIGARGRTFTIFKFRTMRSGSENEGLGVTTTPGDERITRVGKLLRALSLDELPQLLNIALGEMSFIGPRPTLRYQVDSYTARQSRRLLFRPGITGWAQVNGRNSIPWVQRIELDLYYIEHYSLWLDVRILWRTLHVLLRGDGVYAESGKTNDTFHGLESATAEDSATTTALEQAPPRLQPPAPPEGIDTPASAAPSILIVGAGGHAHVVIDVIERQGDFHVLGFVDQRHEEIAAEIMGYRVLGGREVLEQPGMPRCAFVAIGSPGDREAWQNYLESRGFDLPILLHPSAQIGRNVELGAGTVLMPGSIVNVGARLGRGVIVNTGASVDHDCEIGDFAHIAPGARLAGNVRVGTRSHVGIGACVIQGLVIGNNAIVGAGAAVVRNVVAERTVGGVPARQIPKRRKTTKSSQTVGTA